jgi:hypothetical protein
MVQGDMDGAGWADIQDYRHRTIAEAVAEKFRSKYGDRIKCRVIEVIYDAGWRPS